jgi:biopolymer transport protein TolQ
MQPVNLSLISLITQATGVVQAVLALLVLCSIVCWAVIMEKSVLLSRYKRQAAGFEAWVRGGAARLTDSPARGLPAAVLAEGREESSAHKARESGAERRERIEQAMHDAMAGELHRAEVRLPYLAIIGSAAPFIGLFGTIWGIMHAFVSIAQTSQTSLAVVAPGIAESLFTTAAGLAAAIPASIAYNKLASDFAGVTHRLSLAIAMLARKFPDSPQGTADDPA